MRKIPEQTEALHARRREGATWREPGVKRSLSAYVLMGAMAVSGVWAVAEMFQNVSDEQRHVREQPEPIGLATEAPNSEPGIRLFSEW